MTEHSAKGTPCLRSQIMNAGFRMWSLKQVVPGLILSYVTLVNDPTSLNLDPCSFSNRDNHVLTSCCGHQVTDSEWKCSVSSKILPTLVLCHLLRTSPLFCPQHFPLPMLPKPRNSKWLPEKTMLFWCWACLGYYQSSFDVAKFFSTFKSQWQYWHLHNYFPTALPISPHLQLG